MQCNNNISIKIPRYPYVLINRTVLCNCRIEGEDLIMYFTVNTAFIVV